MAMLDDGNAVLRQRVRAWALRLKVSPRIVRVQRMTQKWGSCSTGGIVTLASDLAAQDESFQDFVIAHELLHLKIPNHGRVFKAMMSLHVPDWRLQDIRRQSVGLAPGHAR
ncbi:M48 family metallopeptidase [Bosea massiliensis]|uniref:M48 family metallopeptidase n=1 Tax=Bosea massiliensis TaxID=151419 RepID=A0ABW0NZC6_9HYPH